MFSDNSIFRFTDSFELCAQFGKTKKMIYLVLTEVEEGILDFKNFNVSASIIY